MKTVYFGRHGQAIANQQGLLAGSQTDSPLTRQGESEAAELARSFGKLQIDLIVSSPLERAFKTAEIVAEQIGYKKDILVEPLFIERDFGSATNRPRAEAFTMLDNGLAEGAESVSEFGSRADKALEWLNKRPEKTILVVSHAGFGQILGTRARGGRAQDFLQFDSLSNASFFKFRLE
ncbi:MAG: histidine phosphatase family protein [Candidatus Saccharimonadales bacterium]